MEIILTLFYLCFGIAILVAMLHLIVAILMLFVPLSPARQAALVRQLREEQREYLQREAPMRAQMLEERLSKEAKALLASFELSPSSTDQKTSGEIVPFPTRRARRPSARPLHSSQC